MRKAPRAGRLREVPIVARSGKLTGVIVQLRRSRLRAEGTH